MYLPRKTLTIGLIFLLLLNSIEKINAANIQEIAKHIENNIKTYDIPGLSLIIVKDDTTYFYPMGYKNVKKNQKITNQTLFELGSCSKAFSALAILKLEEEKLIDIEKNVSDYLPWFKVYYKNRIVKITIRQLIYHTSAIPWHTISQIPQCEGNNCLEKTIRTINQIKLQRMPGERYEYATINYDILALIIEKVTGQSFKDYMEKKLFKDLGLVNTTLGRPRNKDLMAQGYKIGFFNARSYTPPIFEGNFGAGYVISNAEDIARWLKLQLGKVNSSYNHLIIKSHERDKSVMPNHLSSYAYGWNVSLRGDEEIYHDGLNPNFSSFLAIRKNSNLAIAVLSNSNSPYTSIIGQNIIKAIDGEKINLDTSSDNSFDKAFSVISIILGVYLLFILFFLSYIVYGMLKGKRVYESINLRKIGYALLMLLFLPPFLFGIYLLPKAMAGFTWEAAIVWTPISFFVAVILCVTSIVLSYITYLITLIFPEKNKYLREAPKIILLSVLSGLSNMVVILLITSSLKNNMELKFTLYYFGLTMVVYLLGRKIVQTKMIHITRNIIYDLRMKLVHKVFSTSYEKFEKIDRGRIYSTMNDDIGTIGQSANTFVNIATSIITAGGAFIYMATLAFWATLITVLLVGSISTIYYIVSRKTRVLFDEARETRTVYMRLLNGMIDGFKELSIHRKKKNEYKNDVEVVTDEYRKKISTAEVKFVNAFLIGESLLIILLATVVFAVPRMFSNVQFYTIMSFIIILLYLIGPVNAILSSVPQLMQLRIAWNRVKCFIHDIPANLNLSELIKETVLDDKEIQSLKAKSLSFQYKGAENKEGFSVGPINFEIYKGEALFIIGGNGSGKTTIAKLLTGLYSSQSGEILINDKKVNQHEIGEFFSTVFNPFHLFQKLYDVEIFDMSKNKEVNELLEILQLDKKVSIKNNEYSTIDLSGGQRKRLALLQCYLEDKPIYLFDEWAADQDPVYRKYFYRELLPAMKQQGKIIIAVTHDDHYFDVADKILKLDVGKVEYYKSSGEVEKEVFTKA